MVTRRAVERGAASEGMPPAGSHNLPAQPTLLIGREAELAALRARLQRADARLVTLTGPPGAGKTRLALAVAATLVEHFEHGVWFVPLDAVRELEEVPGVVAQALDVRESARQSVRDALVEHLSSLHLLLVLDNFEHLVEAAPFVANLLASCPRVGVLVTSRTALRLRWEQRIAVEPLAVPDAALHDRDAVAATASVALYLGRARATTGDLDWGDAELQAAAEVCRRLDGLPLAIELAAARSRLFPPRAVLSRLEPRLAFLSGGPRDLPARHQTLRAALDWSYELLSPAEQAVFRRFGVFFGGATVEAAVTVAVDGDGDGVDPNAGEAAIAALVDHCLLRREDGAAGEPRLRMLETVREYALARLTAAGEVDGARLQHAAAYLSLAEIAETQLTGPAVADWLERLELEQANITAVIAWAAESGSPRTALQLCGALARYWEIRSSYSAGRRLLEQSFAIPGRVPGQVRAKALEAAARLAEMQGDLETARVWLEESLALRRETDDPRGIAFTLHNIGRLAYVQTDLVSARPLFEEALALWREAGDREGIAASLNTLGAVSQLQGALDRAEEYFTASLDLFQELGDISRVSSLLNNLGLLASRREDYAAARSFLDQSLGIKRALGDRNGAAAALANLAEVALEQGDHTAAAAAFAEALGSRREAGDTLGVATQLIGLGWTAFAFGDPRAAEGFFREALPLSQQVGSRRHIAFSLDGFGWIAATDGRLNQAARLFGAADAIRDAAGTPVGPGYQRRHEGIVATMRAALSDAAFAAAWTAGSALALEDAIAEALTVNDEREAMSDESTPSEAHSSLIAHRSSLPDGLTAREVDVLRLLASGRTAKQIAEELVLSLHTVERHIANLYRKIDAHGRAEATAYAIRRGLV